MDEPTLLSPDEENRINQEAYLLDDERVAAELEALARREVETLRDPRFASGEMREITLWNLTVLVAAAERLGVDVNLGRTGRRG